MNCLGQDAARAGWQRRSSPAPNHPLAPLPRVLLAPVGHCRSACHSIAPPARELLLTRTLAGLNIAPHEPEKTVAPWQRLPSIWYIC
jgi:hypothetical protein